MVDKEDQKSTQGGCSVYYASYNNLNNLLAKCINLNNFLIPNKSFKAV